MRASLELSLLFFSFFELPTLGQPANTDALISNTNGTDLGADFSGLAIRFSRQGRGPNQWTPANLAIVAIHAMHEEALLQWDERLAGIDYSDLSDPDNRVRIRMAAVPAATVGPHSKAIRSTVMWTLKNLTVELMRLRCLRPLPFQTIYALHILYNGMLEDTGPSLNLPTGTANTTIDSKATIPPVSLHMSAADTTRMALKVASPLQNDPHYELRFHFVDVQLSEFNIFESIMDLLLVLGELDATSEQVSYGTTSRGLDVGIYMIGLGTGEHPFQQFLATAILEAIARYYIQHNRYQQMTFDFLADGMLAAHGCVTKATQARAWCNGLPSDQSVDIPSGLDQISATN